MRRGKNSDSNSMIDKYLKSIRNPKPSSPEFYDYAKRNLEALMRNDPKNEVYRLWKRCNADKKGREARFRKKTIYLSWLFIKINGEKRVIEYLNTFSSSPLNIEKEPEDWKKFIEIVDQLNNGNILNKELILKDSAGSFDARSIHRHKKNKIIEKALTIMRLDPEIELIERQNELVSGVEKEMYRFKNFSPQMIDFIFTKLNKKKYFDSAQLKKKIKELILADKFLGKIINDLREAGGTLKMRNILRKHTKTTSELRPYLRYLKNVKLAFQKNGVISLNSYDSENNKKFTWVDNPSYWAFGPKLEKGKVYNSNDFIRQDVVEKWVETGSAKFI